MLGKKINYDKAFGYQCVDLFKDYINKVYGIIPGRVGNANQIRTNRFKVFDKRRVRILGTSDLKQGDIIISMKGKYGHIAIVHDPETATVIEQNGVGGGSGRGGNAIRLKKYPKVFWKGVRRFNS